MKETVSVVIPLYNCAGTIGRTIRSVREQTHADLEIIAVDDASPDDAAAVVAAEAAVDPRIRLLRNDSNRGIAATLNHGARHASGQFIAPLDSDDVWAPNKLEAQLAALRRGGPDYGFAYAPFQRIDAEDRVLFSAPAVVVDGWGYLPLIAENFIGNGSALLIRREAFDSVGGFMENKGAYSSDDLLIQLAIARNWKICCAPEYLVGYRMVRGSTSSNYTRGAHSRIRVLEIIEQRHPETPKGPLNRRRAETYARWGFHCFDEGRVGTGLGKLAEAFRRDPATALYGVGFYFLQKLRALRRDYAPPPPGVSYFSPDNDRTALRAPRGVTARRIAKALALEVAFRKSLGAE